MRKRSVKYRSLTPFVGPILFLVLVIVGTFLTVRNIKEQKAREIPKGKIAVPVSLKNIPAFTRIQREHLDILHLDPKHLSENVKTSLSKVRGRVLRRDKKKGYVFSESDFLPKGTREGFVGGIPPGKRAFTIETDKVRGLYGLNTGDRFDLMVLYRNQKKGQSLASTIGVDGQPLNTPLSEPQTIVESGSILVPTQMRKIPFSQQTLTQGVRMRTKDVRETIISVRPEEIEGLVQALSMEAELYIVPRSGRPEAKEDPATTEVKKPKESSGKFQYIDTMKGGERKRIAVPVERG